MPGVFTVVAQLPDCDICSKPKRKARIDGATTTGRWAFMCELCFNSLGSGLGTGKGQVLLTQEDIKPYV